LGPDGRKHSISNDCVKLNDNTAVEYYENKFEKENGEIIVQYYKRRLVGTTITTIQTLIL
jgi:hypothetical protein